MGKFWAKCRDYTTRRMLFMSMVQGALYSGMECFTLTSSEHGQFDRFLLGKIRKLMHGTGCKKQVNNGVTRYTAADSQQVWRWIRLAPSQIELRIRRLQFWQRVSRFPHDHNQLLATMFGQAPWEEEPMVDAAGKITGNPHKWIALLQADIA
eukprot:3732823-Pyramimonas_sp.AAC.1